MQSLQTLNRRTLLRGLGAAVGLPWLEAMTPTPLQGKSRAPASPIRMAVLYMPNGTHPDQWTPRRAGSGYDLSPTLEPLAELNSDVHVLTNLWNAASNDGDGHFAKTAGFLTSTTITKTLGIDISANGVSMDQVAAQKLGGRTPVASLELGTEPVSTGVGLVVGYTKVYGGHISWNTPTSPLAREINPRLAFERLFRAGRPGDGATRQDSWLLDLVVDDAKRLRKDLGVEDQRRMDEYLSVVRSLEDRIRRAGKSKKLDWKPRAPIDPAARPGDEPRDHAERVRLMLDIIALAFQTDSTRIATFMFANAVSNASFSFLDGVSGSHHQISHHRRDPETMRQYQLINRWHVEQYAYLLRKLRSMPEGESNVLDNSMILFGSGLRDGDRHDPHNVPLLLAGRAGGRLEPAQHRIYSEDTPLANLYVSMLNAFGVPTERFADSTGPLTGLLCG